VSDKGVDKCMASGQGLQVYRVEGYSFGESGRSG